MAYLVKRNGGRIEIRESRSTPKGPRSRQLARFTGPLTPAVLATAAAHASRSFDAAALTRRARVMGIAVDSQTKEPEARALLARLRRGDAVDPIIAGLLVQAMDAVPTAALPDAFAEVAEWIGATPAARGEALRQLLDMVDRITSSRPRRKIRPRETFPRFSSDMTAAAS